MPKIHNKEKFVNNLIGIMILDIVMVIFLVILFVGDYFHLWDFLK